MRAPHRYRVLLALVLCWPASVSGQAASPDSAGAQITGRVTGRFQDQIHALPFAMIEAVVGTERKRVMTDASGRYRMSDVNAGEVSLTVTHAGYQPLGLAVAVPAGESVVVDLELLARPVALAPLEVEADEGRVGREPTREESRRSLTLLERAALEVGPGLGQAGIADLLASLPGSDPGDATDVLYMRGSTADMKLVLLDGVPVYTPFHVAGLLRSFEPTVIDRAELHVGGAPASFDGGLSHILDLSTRSARRDAVHFTGSLDLLSGSGAVELPLGSRAGVMGSARSLHGLGGSPIGYDPPYGYRDALVSLDVDPTSGHELRLTGFWNEESVALDLMATPDDARWSNRAGSVAYRGDLGGPQLEVTTGVSSYRATLPIQPGATDGELMPPVLLAAAETDRARLVGELKWGEAAAPIRAGVSLEQIDASFSARALSGLSGTRSHRAISGVGTFLDVTRPVAPGLSLRAGLRVDHFLSTATHFAPRASIRWSVAPEAMLTIAAGRYHQPTRAPDVDMEPTLAEVAAGTLESSELLPIATADHFVVSLDQSLSSAVRVGLEGFWKSFQGLPGVGGSVVRSSGVDLRVAGGSDRAAAWLGYGLSWYWSRADLSGRATNFAARHLLTAGASGTIAGPLHGELSVRFGSGLPYTSIPTGYADDAIALLAEGANPDQTTFTQTPESTLSAELDESFLRLDAELYALLEPTWGGRSWRVRPYLRLLNALDRRDALFYAFERWRPDAVRPLAELPVLPLLGVAVSF